MDDINQQPLVDAVCLLEKMPGKGGWTYARIPGILSEGKKDFGMVKVRGMVDGVELRKFHIMPMGNGQMFFPVNAGIRKRIGKEQGHTVHIVLYHDNEPLTIPEEFRICLDEEPDAKAFFTGLSESEQKFYIEWIYSAKKEETRVNRLAKAINKLLQGQKLYQKE